MSKSRTELDPSTIDDSASAPGNNAHASAGAQNDPPDPLPPGTIIGHFAVEHTLGAGGMGVVVAAHDQLLDRKVAIKVLRRQAYPPGLDRGPARLLREAQAMAKLAHPNVVTVFEVDMHAGQIFVAMDRVEGCTLAQWLRDRPRSVQEIIETFVHAARGLAAVHAHDMVHRDFKPENVLVANDGQVRVTDFGLVGMMSRDESEALSGHTDAQGGGVPLLARTLTPAGGLMGTPRYMAPEHYQHAPLTAQADQFAFCVALYEALYSAPPFRGTTATELRESVLFGAPAVPRRRRDAPRWLHRVVLCGLARAPGDRWATMTALINALTSDPATRRRRRWWALAGVATLAAALSIGALARRSEAPLLCPSPALRLTGVWDSPVRAEMQIAFAAARRSYAADTFSRAAGALDRYAQAWLEMRTETCAATAIRHEQSPALLDRRMQCLDRRLVELGALTALFRDRPDEVVVDRAVTAALGLAPLASCADADALLAQVPLPVHAGERAELAALRIELARATALAKAGKPKAALAVVTPLVPRARALGYAPALAEVLMTLGAAQRDVGDPVVAEATLIDVVRTASAARDDTLVAKAMIEQLWVVGYRGGRRGDAFALVPYIEAAVMRAGNDPLVLAGLYRYEAILYNAEGKHTEGLAIAQRGLDLVVRVNPERREAATTLITMGNLHRDRGDLVAARAAYERARTIFGRLYGPDHSEVATIQANLANLLFADGKLAAALETYQATLAIYERVYGPSTERAARVLGNIGMVLEAQDRWEEAAPFSRRALAVYEETLGRDHCDLRYPLANLGDEAFARRRWGETEAYYGRALTICERALGKDSLVTSYPLELMAQLRLAQGRSADALAIAQRILTIREHALEPGNQQIGSALVILGRAEVGLGRARRGASTIERGLTVLTGSKEPAAPDVLGDTWLALARAARQAGQSAHAEDAAIKARQAYQRLEHNARRVRKLRELDAWAQRSTPRSSSHAATATSDNASPSRSRP